ncbi:FHA domain-containing protein [Brucepastera parasyntrophica]|uniref:FHA domain-containing protein n=1 Tax=Brucepastera parasyntrophica TaxID=2880008 RepID=UPI00210A1A71|nr:FHA domain-containing protein [Brucepastera parasyntrophica]ULQ59534.1 FHA domain-containing protein [Brucepastera parasyntrophica]
MQDETIISTSKIGQRLDAISKNEQVSYLMFESKKVPLVSKIKIGRAPDNDVVIDSKLASRYHAVIQKIKDDYFISDLDSTNGTFLNGQAIPKGKYVKLGPNDRITIGKTNLSIT